MAPRVPMFQKYGTAQASLLHEVEKVAKGRMRSSAHPLTTIDIIGLSHNVVTLAAS
jgi:hypothetical protein